MEENELKEKERALEFKKLKKTSSFDHALKKLGLDFDYGLRTTRPNCSTSTSTSPTHSQTNSVPVVKCITEISSVPNMNSERYRKSRTDSTRSGAINLMSNMLSFYRATKRMAGQQGAPGHTNGDRESKRNKHERCLDQDLTVVCPESRKKQMPTLPGGSATRLTRMGARAPIKPTSTKSSKSHSLNKASSNLWTEAPSGLTANDLEDIMSPLPLKAVNTSGLTAELGCFKNLNLSLGGSSNGKQREDRGYLWALRENIVEHIKMNGCDSADMLYHKPSKNVPSGDPDDLNQEQGEYLSQLLDEEQNLLSRELGKMGISNKKEESESEKGMESPIDPTIWKFIILLSNKLEEEAIPNLFGNHPSPTSNLLVRMLENHRLRSTYDFEQAVGRRLNLCN